MLHDDYEVHVSLEETMIEDRDEFYSELPLGNVLLVAVEIIPEFPKRRNFSIEDCFEMCCQRQDTAEEIVETGYSIIFEHEFPIRLSSKKMLDNIHKAYEISLVELSNHAEFQYRYWFMYGTEAKKSFVLESNIKSSDQYAI